MLSNPMIMKGDSELDWRALKKNLSRDKHG